MSLEDDIISRLKAARQAAHALSLAPTELKNRALSLVSAKLKDAREQILKANREDVAAARAEGNNAAFVERLTLNEARIAAMARSIEEIVALPDPIGETIAQWQRPNGLEIKQVRVALGVIAIIYESRPNVTIDAGALALKAGNAAVLRGGREALHTNRKLAASFGDALHDTGLDPNAMIFIDDPDREIIQILKSHPEAIDLIIPRGGKALKEALAGSSVPLLPHFDGICHTYVDRAADLGMAAEICFNAKCSRPSVCNAMETMLVHRDIASDFLPTIAARFRMAGVEMRGCERTRAIVSDALPASTKDWDTEYLDLTIAIRVVDSIDEAIAFIAEHGSGLADAIVTNDPMSAAKFEREVDSATVYVNASTRFTDGFEFGFGAETGISTNRLHARGPMGLRELTTYKYVIRGQGQIRV